jgi:predicted DNA-binding transcriptional regulator AlpA
MSSLIQSVETAALAAKTRLIEADEVRQMYGGVSRRTIWRWADAGVIPRGVRVGGKRFWPLSVIEEALAALEQKAR